MQASNRHEQTVNRLSINHRSQSQVSGGTSNQGASQFEQIDITGRGHGGQQQDHPVATTSKDQIKKHKTDVDKQRSVGTQARIGAPLKILTPRPWKGSGESQDEVQKQQPRSTTVPLPIPSDDSNCSSSVVVLSRPTSNTSASTVPAPAISHLGAARGSHMSKESSRASTPGAVPAAATAAEEHGYAFSSSPGTIIDDSEHLNSGVVQHHTLKNGVQLVTKQSKTSSMKFVMQRSSSGTNDGFKIQEMTLKDGSLSQQTTAASHPKGSFVPAPVIIEPEQAIKALKLKTKVRESGIYYPKRIRVQ